jgi:hypothetical protein
MNIFSTYRKLHLNFSTVPALKITELGFCLAFPWPDPGLSLRLNCDQTCFYLNVSQVVLSCLKVSQSV